ncbi:uncharacterized protein LOC143177829 isoform X2 [Calliopsis andreniformis]|uniref:uncharacterized protein LOC143177829 isoform X2 n=1 Tax=Calliopsis andreniformis TaxID=337506 RepID=UPI003FCCC6D3
MVRCGGVVSASRFTVRSERYAYRRRVSSSLGARSRGDPRSSRQVTVPERGARPIPPLTRCETVKGAEDERGQERRGRKTGQGETRATRKTGAADLSSNRRLLLRLASK